MPSPGVNTGIDQNVTIPRGVTIYLREIGGGITAMMTRWAESQPGGASVSFVLLRDTNRPFTPLDTGILSRASRTTFNGALDNRYLVYREMSRWLKDSDDIIVANDALELGMVSALGTRNPIAFVLHGDYDYYYDLAVGHESRIGSFLCVSDAIRETLARKIPHRAPAIHVTYPVVPESVAARSHSRDHLRLLFVGRLTEEKGFWDLPLIDTELQRAGVDVRWTIVAPREPSLNPDARRWLSSPHVKHIASVPLAGMDAVYATHDLLVFPSRFEGFGIAVLEAMKAGVVPVAARLKAGLPEMI